MNRVPEEVAPGVHRLSLPLPGPPHEVAAWLLRGEGGWILVDTGMDTPSVREALLRGAGELGIGPSDLLRVVLTHAHIDHYGMGDVVRRWSGAPLVLHEREEQLARRWVDGWNDERAVAAADFRAAGAPEDAVAEMLAASDRIHRLYPVFRADQQLRGERGALDGSGGWEWILTPGHSPGHVVLWHAERRLLVAGDHVLPRISPNVGADLYARDPLGDYLHSLSVVRDLPAERVLPSHGPPFSGLAERIDELRAHHELRNRQIVELLAARRTAWEITAALFGALPGDSLLHAFREVAAHLVHLRAGGRVREWAGEPARWSRA